MSRRIRSSLWTRVLGGVILSAGSVTALSVVPVSSNTSYHQAQPRVVASSATSTTSVPYYAISSAGGVIAAASNPTGQGYWTVTSSGQVVAHNGASFYGDTYTDGLTGLTGAKPLNAPITGIIPDPTGGGYWLIAKDGGVFDFGNAQFYGSTYTYGITGLTGAKPLDAPIVGGAAAPNGDGYWLIAKDGGVFNFGGAHFGGSTYDLGYTGLGGSHPLPGAITDLMPNPTGSGYYLATANGKIIPIGGAPAVPNPPAGQKIVALIPSVPTQPNGGQFQPQPLIPQPQPQTPQYPSQPQVEPLTITSTSSLTTSGAVDFTFTASGGTGSNAWSATGLPSGLSLSSSGVLTGTLAASSEPLHTFTVAVTDSAGVSASEIFTLNGPSLVLVVTSPQSINTNGNVDFQFTASGGDGGDTWSAESPLPSGLSLSSSGLLTGTVTQNETIDVTVTDTGGANTSSAFTIDYSAPASLSITSSSSINTNGNVDFQFTASGGDGGDTWSAESPLPSGLSLSSSGLLTGTISSDEAIHVTVTDSAGASTSTVLELAYSTFLTLTNTSFSYNTGSSVSTQLKPSQSGTYTYAIASGYSLPPGLSLSSSGLLTGTSVNDIGSWSPMIDLTDSSGTTTSVQVAITFTPTSSVGEAQIDDANWSGAVSNISGQANQVSGIFAVPTLSSSQDSLCTTAIQYCATSEWVGIDGVNTKYLFQAGVEISAGSGGTEIVTPWWEELTPSNVAPETDFSSFVVHPGDMIDVSLNRIAAGEWQAVVSDETTGQTMSSPEEAFTASAVGSTSETAEWILETPDFGSDSTGSGSGQGYSYMPAVSSGGEFIAQSMSLDSGSTWSNEILLTQTVCAYQSSGSYSGCSYGSTASEIDNNDGIGSFGGGGTAFSNYNEVGVSDTITPTFTDSGNAFGGMTFAVSPSTWTTTPVESGPSSSTTRAVVPYSGW
ncbi:putative Ig domain-containing protein [Ferrimicrobium sp.]|uniref:putative Ig domain-containing protein n=2 Tax=Ferrimicrobium sp. TaxID=2926050 RepID=UPI00261FF34D|nr:putative Ig domain-containing protein [Ferrimicrobium sp.]